MVPGGRVEFSVGWHLCNSKNIWLVQELAGCNSLPVVAREREKVIAFCRWVPTYWYESTLVQDCKEIFLLLKEDIDDSSRWFLPTLGFHLISWCSCVFLMCDALF